MRGRATLFGLLCASSASAEIPATLHVESTVACPSAAQLEAEIRPLLPSTRFSQAAPDVVRVTRETRGIVVSARGETKVLDGAELDCRKHARTAAVFVALTLDPPDFSSDTPDEPPPSDAPTKPEEPAAPQEPTTNETPTTAASSNSTWPWVFEASPWIESALGGDATSPPILGGALLRVRSGRAWGVTASAGFSFDSTWSFGDDQVRVRTIPLDASAFVTLTHGVFELSPELGVTAPVWVSQSLEFEQPEQVRLQLGVRAALSARFWFDESWGMAASLSASLFPRPYSFVVLPTEILGETPSVWLGASLGVAFRMDPG